MQPAAITRSCGECNACCKPFPVPEVGKFGSAWCPHCTIGKGCEIYTERPYACRKFACAWLQGLRDESWRPDRLGVMITGEDLTLRDRPITILHIYEMTAGAFDRPAVGEFIEANRNGDVVLALH